MKTMKRLVTVGAMACVATALAMPTKDELKKAQPLVAELMAPAMAEFKAKTKTAAEVGEVSEKYAAEAETEAAKFLLLKGAMTYYVRAEDYDKAADAVEALKAGVKDVPPSVLSEIISKATVRATSKKAPRLFAQYRQAKMQSAAEADVKELAAQLKKKPDSLALRRKHAEAIAASGDWKAALGEFAKLNDETAKKAKAEVDGTAKSADLGEFWWAYEPTYEGAGDAFKVHAAAHYRQALDAGEITGLKKSIIERRVAEYSAQVDAQMSVSEQTKLFVLPKSARGSEVKLAIDEKHSIDFVSCPAGEFKMGFKEGNSCLKFHSVKISRPFWIAKLPVSYGVLDALIGKPERPFCEKCDFRVDVLGGDETPAGMSHNTALTTLSVLNKKFGRQVPRGYVFRFASEAEYEYVTKSGRSSYSSKIDGEGEMTTFQERLKAVQAKGYSVPEWEKFPWRVPYFAVGSKKANAWNVKDMLTAGWAYTLDMVKCDRERDTEVLTPFYVDGSVDPVQLYDGPGAWCVMRGCGWDYEGKFKGRGWIKFLFEPGDFFHNDGVLRVVVGPDLVSEKRSGQRGAEVASDVPAEKEPQVAQNEEEKKEPARTVAKPTGKPLVLNLTKDLAMEFVPCPAGEFEMGNSGSKDSPTYRHKVKITRPFWIGKYQVSREIWKQFSSDVRLNELKVECGGMKAPMTDMSYNMVEDFCNWLQHRYSGKVKMPKGYVFRLPTEAEWEYALDAGGDLQDDYHRWRDGDDSLRSRIMITKDDYQKIIDKTKVKFPALYHCPALPGGQKKPNAWGVYDMLGNGREFVLDCVSNADYKKGRPTRNLLGTDLLHYEDEEEDPLRYRLEPKQAKGKKVPEGEGRCMLVRNFADTPNGDWYAKGRGVPSCGYGMGATFRVVIGPDLVSEWKAKNGKK